MNMNMNTNMGKTVYWHKNQIIIRVKSQSTQPASQPAPSTSPGHPNDIITITFQQYLNTAFTKLKQNGLLKSNLQIFGSILIRNPLLPANQIVSVNNFDLAFFTHINPNTHPDMESMQGNGGMAGMGNDDQTLDLINQLDYGRELQKELQNQGHSVDVDTIPHWFWAGTDYITQGCPISPPIPVEGLSASAGRWQLQFSQLPDALQEATGKGVTVLVLDTLPEPAQILKAADEADSSNMLLQEMTNGMRCEAPFNALPPAINIDYQPLPDVVEGTPPERVVTGKDIYGRHAGFHIEDHGLFIAGIVRDLAPEANIECIRVLNDFGVGDLQALGGALEKIYIRMSSDPHTHEVGDLYKKPVVINLSLVVLPPGDDMPEEVDHMPKGADGILKPSLDLLYSTIQSLAAHCGALFVAAAGNDSDPRMNASENRFGSRYPAALAYDNSFPVKAMIPVGAVNQDGDAAMYSNYPGSFGVATYGGDLPKPDPWLPSAMSHVAARVDTTDPIDALCGVYTASHSPALSKNDPESEHAVPNSNAWAYWSGTSFATPIISALAARVLQGRDPESIDVRQAILDAATDKVMWTGVGVENSSEDIPGRMIMAIQE